MPIHNVQFNVRGNNIVQMLVYVVVRVGISSRCGWGFVLSTYLFYLSFFWSLHFLPTCMHTCVIFAEEYGHLSVDSQAVFANNEVSLKYIDTYGFDYDYTLACYTSHLPELLYRLCKERLVHASKVGRARGVDLCYLHGCSSLEAAFLCHCFNPVVS